MVVQQEIDSLGLQVHIDGNSGFCFGVVYAIEMAEAILEEHGKLYCLGDIVHNDEEVARLEAKGLVTISHEDLPNLRGEKVLIRAHGEAPETYKIALENDIELLDASCPVVLKLQQRVKESYDKNEETKTPIVIYGKHGHAEIKGLLGQTLGEAKVFMTPEEFDALELPEKVTLFSQTTKDTATYYGYKKKLEERGIEVDFNDTICRQVSNRDLELRKFVLDYDVIVFVAGLKSSNGKVLYEVCKAHNPNTHFVSSASEVDKSWFSAGNNVGICGATSTPQWLMEEVQKALQAL